MCKEDDKFKSCKSAVIINLCCRAVAAVSNYPGRTELAGLVTVLGATQAALLGVFKVEGRSQAQMPWEHGRQPADPPGRGWGACDLSQLAGPGVSRAQGWRWKGVEGGLGE